MRRYVNLSDEPVRDDPLEDGIPVTCTQCGHPCRVHTNAPWMVNPFTYVCAECDPPPVLDVGEFEQKARPAQ